MSAIVATNYRSIWCLDNIWSLAMTFQNVLKDSKQVWECFLSSRQNCFLSPGHRLVGSTPLLFFRLFHSFPIFVWGSFNFRIGIFKENNLHDFTNSYTLLDFLFDHSVNFRISRISRLVPMSFNGAGNCLSRHLPPIFVPLPPLSPYKHLLPYNTI